MPLNSRARLAIARSSSSAASTRSVADRVRVRAREVSTTSEDVRP
jgi:hypothetical protein